MRKATITDIRKRLKGLQTISESNISTPSNTFIRGARSVAYNGRVQDVKKMIETIALTKQEVPFGVFMELYNAVVERGNSSDVQKMTSVICEELVHKVRDSKAFLTLLKQRMGRARSKLKSKAPENANSATIETLPAPVKSTITESINGYERMIETAILYINCDRVIENYNRISGRFNLDKLFFENTRINGVKDTVVELCNKIDTYNIPLDTRFNTVIETALYGFEHNNIVYNKSDILEAAVDYYLFKEDGKEACASVLENSVFFDKDDYMGGIEIITEEEPAEDESIKAKIESFCSRDFDEPLLEQSNFKDIFNKYKEEEFIKDGKVDSKLKRLIEKLYSRDVDGIIDGTPSILSWIRRFFIIGTAGFPVIGPVIMIVGLIADKFIQLGMERKEVLSMIKAFNAEINKTKDKLSTVEDKETLDRLEKYLKSLVAARDKLDEYHNGLLTDDDMEKKYSELEMPSGEDDDDFGFDLDFDDDDLSFDESGIFYKITESSEALADMLCKKYIDDYDMQLIASKLSDESLTSVATIAAKYPDVFHSEAFKTGVNDTLKQIRQDKIKFESSVDKVYKISALQKAIKILETTAPEDPEKVVTIYEAYDNVQMIAEAYEAINLVLECTDPAPMLEASITNKLNMASMKLRGLFQKMSDKDRQISKSVDLSLNNMKKGVERSLTNENRESVIRGSILPSASKIIKMAIVNAGLVAIGQPVIAVIATLGYLGVSAKFKHKERQMLIDEIEIELKMCQKYIDIAEQKNDMKALKQLLMIQRDLQRQQQRIKYKMKVDFGQKYYDAKNVGD